MSANNNNTDAAMSILANAAADRAVTAPTTTTTAPIVATTATTTTNTTMIPTTVADAIVDTVATTTMTVDTTTDTTRPTDNTTVPVTTPIAVAPPNTPTEGTEPPTPLAEKGAVGKRKGEDDDTTEEDEAIDRLIEGQLLSIGTPVIVVAEPDDVATQEAYEGRVQQVHPKKDDEPYPRLVVKLDKGETKTLEMPLPGHLLHNMLSAEDLQWAKTTARDAQIVLTLHRMAGNYQTIRKTITNPELTKVLKSYQKGKSKVIDPDGKEMVAKLYETVYRAVRRVNRRTVRRQLVREEEKRLQQEKRAREHAEQQRRAEMRAALKKARLERKAARNAAKGMVCVPAEIFQSLVTEARDHQRMVEHFRAVAAIGHAAPPKYTDENFPTCFRWALDNPEAQPLPVYSDDESDDEDDRKPAAVTTPPHSKPVLRSDTPKQPTIPPSATTHRTRTESVEAAYRTQEEDSDTPFPVPDTSARTMDVGSDQSTVSVGSTPAPPTSPLPTTTPPPKGKRRAAESTPTTRRTRATTRRRTSTGELEGDNLDIDEEYTDEKAATQAEEMEALFVKAIENNKPLHDIPDLIWPGKVPRFNDIGQMAKDISETGFGKCPTIKGLWKQSGLMDSTRPTAVLLSYAIYLFFYSGHGDDRGNEARWRALFRSTRRPTRDVYERIPCSVQDVSTGEEVGNVPGSRHE